MFKAYTSSQSSDKDEQEEKKVLITSLTTTNNNTPNENSWLENRSFSIESPLVSVVQTKSKQQVDVKYKDEEKKPINKPIQTTTTTVKKTDSNKDIFYIDHRRDRANITVQYTHGIPRYGSKFCNQHPLGSRITKHRKQRIIRYFHKKFDEIDNQSTDSFVIVDQHLEQLNTNIREHPQSFECWKELIDYQYFLYKTNGEQDKLNALFNKQLSIIDRALELNSNRLQYRLLKLNIRTQSHLFSSNILLNEWSILIKDCLKSSDDRTINETWFSYIRFLLTHIEVFSMDKLNDIFKEYFSTYIYYIQTRSEKAQRFLLNHMIDMLQLWLYVLRESGFIERALEIYQIMIELHFDTNNDFIKKLNHIEENWSTKTIFFGEECNIENSIEYVENELINLSKTENNLFNSTFQSWLSIEQLRINFYQLKIINHSIHFHSNFLQSLSDTSQIDHDKINLTYSNHIHPYLFQIKDQRQILQFIFYYLHFLNALPQSNIIHEILNRLKLSLSNHFHDQFIIEQEFQSLCQLLYPIEIIQTEQRFSMEYICKVYEQLIMNSLLKSYQIDFILLYWYYLAENFCQIRIQNHSLSKLRLKSLQTNIKKYLSLDEYRTCLRLYTHYAQLEYEYFERIIDARRIFDLCFQTIRTNSNNFISFDSYKDLCHWLSTSIICEFHLNDLFNQMLKIILNNQKYISLEQQINREKLSLWINYILNKLFPNMLFNDIITLVIQCLKSPKISKWDQKSEQNDWSIYLRQNTYFSFEILFIFLNYSYLLHDPFDKLQQIVCTSILPLINEQRNKTNQFIIDYLLRFHLTLLWNELFTEHLLFNQCTNYLKQLLNIIQYPSIILLKFTSFYTCLLPLYGSYANEYERLILSYRFNDKYEYRLITKMIVLQMNFIRHLKIQKSNSINEKFNSGYEHRVRRIIRQLIQDYPFYIQLWIFYEYFEKSSLNINRMKGVLYDAMQNSPWAKIFYLKSISHANNETEWKLFLNVMLKSNIRILFSLEEFDMLKELFEMKT